jgi:UDP-N-acetylglucosamine--N-acetylmuramyl-(pentapeptide) pyrophosphoryl-undecaprenol N-acetylglucosamine transferase
LPVFTRTASNWQWFHLSGLNDEEKVRKDYAAAGLKAAVHSFFSEMETAMGAATAAVSRAGASSLAELAAARLPAVLVPYPAATDNHQFHNAREFERTGAARLLEQKHASPDRLAHLLMDLVQNAAVREQVKTALVQWHSPRAAQQIAESILAQVADVRAQARVGNAGKPGHLKSDRGGDANATALQSNCADRAELAPAFERGDTYKSGRRPRPPIRLREILR